MAKKFNNGQTFGEIRQILNDNADEINANKTAVENAKKTAETLADSGIPGRVKGMPANSADLTSLSKLFEEGGSMKYQGGAGIPEVRKLAAYDFGTLTDADNLPYGVPFLLDGGMLTVGTGSVAYLNGYKKGFAYALMLLINGTCVVLELNDRKLWVKKIGPLANNPWQELSVNIPHSNGITQYGSILGTILSTGGNMQEVWDNGNVTTTEGKAFAGVPYVSSLDFYSRKDPAANLPAGLVYINGQAATGSPITGTSLNYGGAWKNGHVEALVFICSGYSLAVDMDTHILWATHFGELAWHRVNNEPYTLPVASANTLGGIKPSSTVAVDADGVASIPENVVLTGFPRAPMAYDGPVPYQVMSGRLINGEAIVRGFAAGGPNITAVGDFAYLGFSNPGAPISLTIFGPYPQCAKRVDVIVKSVSDAIVLPIVLINQNQSTTNKKITFTNIEPGLTYRINLTIFGASNNLYSIFGSIEPVFTAD